VATGGGASWGSKSRRHRSPACPNERRGDILVWPMNVAPKKGLRPIEKKKVVKTLTLFGHPFMTDHERRFAPTTVRIDRNAVRYGSEQVSAFIGIRYCEARNKVLAKLAPKSA